MSEPQRRVSTRSLRKGALIAETYAICRAWDRSMGYQENIERVRHGNIVGAANNAWMREVVATFTQRFPDVATIEPLVVLVQTGMTLDRWRSCLLYHLAERDALYYTYSVEWLFPTFAAGTAYLRTDDLMSFVRAQLEPMVAAGKLTDTGRVFVARDLLRMSGAFGLLTKGTPRQFQPYHLPDACLLYALHALAERTANALHIIEAPEWRLYLMTPSAVEHALLRLHQFRRLHYQAAGSIVELKLPYATRLDYAESLAYG